MIGAFWNIRGLNKKAMIHCLNEFISTNRLDFVGIQETKKNKFDESLLNAINRDMAWNSVPTKGTT
jgi:exonuclease III